MMNQSDVSTRRAIIILTVSITIGLVTVWLIARWMSSTLEKGNVSLVVAARDINPGERLIANDLKLTLWPAGSVMPGANQSIKPLEGRVVTQPILLGEAVVEHRLATNGSKAGLSALITPGSRAMSVKVNEVVGVAGFATPGNFVDILVTINRDNKPPISKIVLEKIRVLATAQDHTIKDDSKPRVVNAVTLEVTPIQAEHLDLARSVGSLSMVLRNQMDSLSVKTNGALIPDILNVAREDKPALQRTSGGRPRENAVYEIELIKGVQLIRVQSK
ncbi:MAG: Flp pilus assembly protein CpaB [Burkholderiales bacterium]|jgi:pilus assembly protein CpaB